MSATDVANHVVSLNGGSSQNTRHQFCRFICMITSSNGNIFRVTGLCVGNSPGNVEFPCDAELWCFLWSAPEPTIAQTIETPVTWDATAIIITSLWLKQTTVQILKRRVESDRWLRARLQYLQCVSNKDTAVLHWAIEMPYLLYITVLRVAAVRSHRPHGSHGARCPDPLRLHPYLLHLHGIQEDPGIRLPWIHQRALEPVWARPHHHVHRRGLHVCPQTPSGTGPYCRLGRESW